MKEDCDWKKTVEFTDNYYTSTQLAGYLKQSQTDFCGILRKNRRNIPKEVVHANLRKGEVYAMQNNCTTVLKLTEVKEFCTGCRPNDEGDVL